ncbi:MAG TPA: hypothetical protein PK657_01185 [Legionella sp.]|nr:hypothetical protein [Legionella sp.]
MLYRLMINYFRIKLLRIVIAKIMGSRVVKSKNVKTINMLNYGLEFLAAYFLNPKKKVK